MKVSKNRNDEWDTRSNPNRVNFAAKLSNGVCSVENFGDPVLTRTSCSHDDHKLWMPVDPRRSKTEPTSKTSHIEDAFWERVQRQPGDGCWHWLKGKSSGGYGVLNWFGKKSYAHRVAYELANGPIPEGAFICHTCNCPACCNPAHLYVGDALTNAADRENSNRGNRLRGSQHPNAKLNEELVCEIRSRLNDGESATRLAKEYGVSVTTIIDAAQGTTWNQVTCDETPA